MTNKIPDDAGHLIRTEIDSTDFKKENLTSKIRKDKTKKPYLYKEKKNKKHQKILKLLKP